MVNKSIWLALAIGNSRLHWAWFKGEELFCTWDTAYLANNHIQQLAKCRTWEDLPLKLALPEQILKADFIYPIPLYLVSVVPNQTELWRNYPNLQVITLDNVPLKNKYSTLGSDRALALWGAKETWGMPALVIDAGTALTFTGIDADFALIGGAILPGLSLQFQVLEQKTANLSSVELPQQLPPHFARNTTQAIQSGIIYSLIAGMENFINSWWEMYPHSQVILTGGDRLILFNYLYCQFPQLAKKVKCDRHLIFWGMQAYRKAQNLS
ncbi:pantothenate kinase [Synechocystis sp. PCC 7509]|uniref:pantothenate kinase n=1 Tax=Synechocystis sp. PCC 7509 TaxID=927677 RepID=UPI0002AC1A88|nr:pantothenate kinase [Synechocystis sp. PCC 7509]